MRVFDDLQPGQQIGLLALVGSALTDPTISAPPLTAASEGAVAAIFAMLRGWLDLELDAGQETTLRQLILGAIGDEARDYPLPAVTNPDGDEWEMLIEEVEDRLLWDADFEMGDIFLDLPPGAGKQQLELHGIDADYYLAVPDDPNPASLAVARRALARLTGRTPPGRG